MRIQEFTGKTTQEAIDSGLAELGVTIADVRVDVLQEGAKGLFGLFGSKPARVRLTVMEEQKEDDQGLRDLLGSFSLNEPQKKKPAQKPARQEKPERKPQEAAKPKAQAPKAESAQTILHTRARSGRVSARRWLSGRRGKHVDMPRMRQHERRRISRMRLLRRRKGTWHRRPGGSVVRHADLGGRAD